MLWAAEGKVNAGKQSLFSGSGRKNRYAEDAEVGVQRSQREKKEGRPEAAPTRNFKI
jgi:hypothetical protein